MTFSTGITKTAFRLVGDGDGRPEREFGQRAKKSHSFQIRHPRTKAALLGALIGATGGGEKDEHGHIINRGIGGIPGAAAGLGGAYVSLNSVPHGKAVSITRPLAGAALGALGGYGAAKLIGPKYNREKKK